MPCRVKAVKDRSQEVKVAVYDNSFYTFVAYIEEGKPSIDPTKDPLFADRQAQVRVSGEPIEAWALRVRPRHRNRDRCEGDQKTPGRLAGF